LTQEKKDSIAKIDIDIDIDIAMWEANRGFRRPYTKLIALNARHPNP